MIFVSVGTHEAPFDRLLRGVEQLSGRDELVVQCGQNGYRPTGATCFDFLPFDDVVRHVRSASVVITHAGVGSVAVSLANGKRPVVVPRRQELGEHVDNHQVAFAQRLASTGLVTLVDDPATLPDIALPPSEIQPTSASSALVDDLAAYLHEVIEGTRPTSAD